LHLGNIFMTYLQNPRLRQAIIADFAQGMLEVDKDGLPALSNAKARSHIVRCQSNLRRIALALNLYVQDEGSYPYALLVVGPNTVFRTWSGSLVRYTSQGWTNALFKCPSYRGETLATF
jgi:hypothetical protein